MADNIKVLPDGTPAGVEVATDEIGGIHHPQYKMEFGADGTATSVSSADPLPVSTKSFQSISNSSTSILTAGSTFEGEWEDVSAYTSTAVAVKTDQNGTFTVQYSPDGINQDSTLTRYYIADPNYDASYRIEAPHVFVNARKYCRITFTSTSATDQTYFRLQTTYGNFGQLNAPLDSALAQDFDAIATRPTDYNSEVAQGRRQGATLWNKFGYNADVDVGTEVIASWGGSFTPLLTATTIRIASLSANDIVTTGTGCQKIVVYGIDENRDEALEIFEMQGTTDVDSTSTWLGINRVVMYVCGTGMVNAGEITITELSGGGGSTMAQMPAGGGVTQQCIFHVPRNHSFIAEWIRINVLNKGKNAELLFKFWVYSSVSNGKQEVYRAELDTQISNDIDESPHLPFPVTGGTVIWIECTSNKADVSVNGRFSGILTRDVGS